MKIFKQVALRAVRQASRSLLRNYNRIKDSDIHYKGTHDLVTRADIEANKIILATIKRRFPSHDFLSEETGLEDNPGAYQWVIDPLDGTTNYTMHNPLFCTSLSLVYGGLVLMSVVYAPILDELYYAEQGKGAWLNGKKIHVSRVKRMSDALILIGKAHGSVSYANFIEMQRGLRDAVLNIRVLGSTSLNLAYVAAGRVEGYVLVPPEVAPWDSLAGTLLVREAGGTVTDVAGRPWQATSRGIVATNGVIHKKLVQSIKK